MSNLTKHRWIKVVADIAVFPNASLVRASVSRWASLRSTGMQHLSSTILLSLLLTACALPEPYSHEQADAATVYFSQTSDISMSKVSAWSLQLTAMDPQADARLRVIGFPVSSRINGYRPAHLQFEVLNADEYGKVVESFKLPPGQYRISAINLQRTPTTSAAAAPGVYIPVPGAFLPVLYDESLNNRSDGSRPFGFKAEKAFEPIIFEVQPGKAHYLGNLRAYLEDCANAFFSSCDKVRIEIRDRFDRDTGLLKTKAPKLTQFENRTLQIDRKASPRIYSVK